MLPTEEKNINWNNIKNSIINIRKPVYSKDEVIPVESRILKVISAILNKIIRQDLSTSKVFSTLYKEAYLPGKVTWDLDPIILYYFNLFFSKKGKTVFYDENARLISDPDHSENEDRFIILGYSFKAKLLVVVHIYKEQDELIRIISARKATKNESKYYTRRR